MKESLKEKIVLATTSAGVYQFVDAGQNVLYVGKAKNLRNRLKSYADSGRHNSRISKMISQATDVIITTTGTENEALLLECNLIKKLMPRYNILLRDDKSFANILVDLSHSFPAVVKHRGAKKISEKQGGRYFGPFASNNAIYQTLDVLKKSFLLRSCSDNEFARRKKPCMEYQIKKCSAPCVGLIDQEEYGILIKEVLDFLSGKKADLQMNLAQKMQQHSDDLEFEKAQIFKERIAALSTIQAKQNIHLKYDENIDVVAMQRAGNLACIVVAFFRSGNNYGFKPYFLNIASDDEDQDVMRVFLEQFYSRGQAPDLFLSHEIAGDFFKFSVPKRGEKLKLLQNYLKIAANELQKKQLSQIKDKEMLLQLKKMFELEKMPQRIEIYDNSHTSGSHAVGAFVVAGPDGFAKNAYRKFTIKHDQLEDKKDDCAFLKQVLRRRFKMIKEKNTQEQKNAENQLILPDLIIIDGGKGQLNAAAEVFADLGLQIKFVAMSKGKDRNAGKEWFHQIDKSSFTLASHLPVMYYLQRLRDEAHRFAIGFNRQKRGKDVSKSWLDGVAGIGATRKKQLLNHFGSVAAIKQATMEDLLLVKGISKNVARDILGG